MRRVEVLAVVAALGLTGMAACASAPKRTERTYVMVQSAEGVTLRYAVSLPIEPDAPTR